MFIREIGVYEGNKRFLRMVMIRIREIIVGGLDSRFYVNKKEGRIILYAVFFRDRLMGVDVNLSVRYRRRWY